MRNIILWIVVALVCSQGVSKAEIWSPLDAYVAETVLIVKAKAIIGKDERISFEVVETWKGNYDPKNFVQTTPEGRYFSSQGGTGLIDISAGQEVILFFTGSGQDTMGKLNRHSTTFPVRGGKVIYASTNDQLRQELPIEDFRARIQELVKRDDALWAMIDALSFERLYVLKHRIDKHLEESKVRAMIPPLSSRPESQPKTNN